MVSKAAELLRNHSIQYTFMSILASGINFITLIIFGRVFSVDDYGVVMTMQALVANIAVFMTPLQIIICKNLAEDPHDHTQKINGSLNMLLVINTIEIVVLGVAGTYVSTYLHFSDHMEYILLMVLVLANNLYIVLSGVAQGRQHFVLLGSIGIILYGIKIMVGAGLGLAGMGVAAVIIGFAAAEVICILLIVKKEKATLSEQMRQYHFAFDGSQFWNYIWTLVLYVVVSFYMNNGDLLLGNLYCSQHDIGLYSVAINLSKISVFLIATPIATILLPKIAEKKGNTKVQQKNLLLAETVTFVISVMYSIVFFAAGNFLIVYLYGADYHGAVNYILPCVVFSTVLGMFWVFYQYAFATYLMKLFTVITVLMGIAAMMVILMTKCQIEIIPLIMTAAMIATVIVVYCVGKARLLIGKI